MNLLWQTMSTTIFLDAGHGGSDPGAVYKGRQEKGRYARPHPCCRRNSGKLWFPRHLFPYGGTSTNPPIRKPRKPMLPERTFSSPSTAIPVLIPNQYSGVESLVFQRMASRRHHSHQYQPTAGGNRLQKSGSQRPAKPGSSAPYRYASRSGRSRLHQ